MITVLGSSGFIGSHLVRHLRDSGVAFQEPARDESLSGRQLGDVIYCIGLTGDFRDRPYDAVEAHVCKLLDVVRNCAFDSILYLSSARVYIRNHGLAREEDDLSVNPLHFDDLYNLSKATGESIVLSLGAKGRVARPSDVYGAGQNGTFLSSILQEAERHGTITLRSSLQSSRDYVSVIDIAEMLVKVALQGQRRIYNLASGTPVTHAAVTEAIARLTGCTVTVAEDAPHVVLPQIDTDRIRTEFGFRPAHVLDQLPSLIASYA